METIRLTGPGLLTKTLFQFICHNKDTTRHVDDNGNGNHNSNNNNNDNNNNNNNRTIIVDHNEACFENIVIFPFSFFNPVPNNENTDLKDEKSKNITRKKYLTEPEDSIVRNENKLIENQCINSKSNAICQNKTEDTDIDENNILFNSNKNKHKMIFVSYAIHWWQKSWQI